MPGFKAPENKKYFSITLNIDDKSFNNQGKVWRKKHTKVLNTKNLSLSASPGLCVDA